MFLSPPDEPGVVYEFFAPFAHIPGRYEWCRIRSPTHGVFDCFIVLGESTSVAADVYVNSDIGVKFMEQRYPECRTWKVGKDDLRIQEAGLHVRGALQTNTGPVTEAAMSFNPLSTSLDQVPYGGNGEPVWGGKYTCWGVDLTVDAKAIGHVVHDGEREDLDCQGIVTAGSFARIAPLE